MRIREAGFTLIEILAASAIAAIIGTGAGGATMYILKNNQQNTDHMNAIFYADNAWHWINQDAMMANSITTENLTAPQLLMLKWTDWDQADNPVYHVVTYSVVDLKAGVGSLKRVQVSSQGTSENTTIGGRIHYSGDNTSDSTWISFQASKLDVRIAAVYGGSKTVMEYQVTGRPNF